jgi:outer membrane protein OmpA-like peptidoglycan-associated protein
MKNLMLTLVFAFAITTLSAQNESEKNTENQFNKWSVELAGGINKIQKPMTPGYYTASPNLFVVDLGARYMFNNKFGLKADFGYNSFSSKNTSKDFDSKYYRFDVQGVANLARIMNFENWTNTIGLLGHAGFGLGQVETKNGNDKVGNFIAGITGQIKLTNRIALTGDFSTILNANQGLTFDGASSVKGGGFASSLFTGTVGVTVYLGKNKKHADWVIIPDAEVLSLQEKVANLETKMNDSDKDGILDFLDLEPNSIAGIMVDTKGRTIDNNKNGIADEIENYLSKTYVNKGDQQPAIGNEELIKNLINTGYINAYFDLNKSTPTNVSTEGIDFILTYLRNNPSASVDIIGHADELGKSAYNDKLSAARANQVKTVLMKANIDASRLNVVAGGEDASVKIDSENARKLVRRVTFKVK